MIDYLAGLNWSVALDVLLWTALVVATLQALRTAQHAEAHAMQAELVGDYLLDRCGASYEEVDRWHREQHPGCFEGETRGGES